MGQAVEVEAPTFVEIHAKVIRADGTVDDLGIVNASYKSPWRQAYWRCVRKPLVDRRIRQANKNLKES